MRITATNIPAHALVRGKSAQAPGMSRIQEGAGSPPDMRPLDTSPANAAEVSGKNSLPRGLEQVLARLQSTPVSERNHGQSMALERVSRNIQRYVDMRDLGQESEPVSVQPPSEPLPSTETETVVTDNAANAASAETDVTTPEQT